MPTFKEDLHLGHSVPTIDTEDIEDGAITEKKMADGSVSTRTIQDGAVTEPKIANRAVTEPKLADWAVSTRTVRDKAISERKLADLSVSTRTMQDKSVTNSKIADSTISMGKLDNDVQTKIQQGTQRAWTPKGAYDAEAVYDVNDLVYHTDTNSSYISLQANNQGHNPTWQSATGGWWMKVVDGSYVNLLEEELQQLVDSISDGTQQQVEELNEALEALEAQADQSRQDIQDIVNSLAVVQTTGQSATAVMSQKAVTNLLDEIDKRFEREDDVIYTKLSVPSNQVKMYANALPLVIGGKYKFTLSCDNTGSGNIGVYLYQDPSNTQGNVIQLGRIDSGESSATLIYEHSADADYHYLGYWSNRTGTVIINCNVTKYDTININDVNSEVFSIYDKVYFEKGALSRGEEVDAYNAFRTPFIPIDENVTMYITSLVTLPTANSEFIVYYKDGVFVRSENYGINPVISVSASDEYNQVRILLYKSAEVTEEQAANIFVTINPAQATSNIKSLDARVKKLENNGDATTVEIYANDIAIDLSTEVLNLSNKTNTNKRFNGTSIVNDNSWRLLSDTIPAVAGEYYIVDNSGGTKLFQIAYVNSNGDILKVHGTNKGANANYVSNHFIRKLGSTGIRIAVKTTSLSGLHLVNGRKFKIVDEAKRNAFNNLCFDGRINVAYMKDASDVNRITMALKLAGSYGVVFIPSGRYELSSCIWAGLSGQSIEMESDTMLVASNEFTDDYLMVWSFAAVDASDTDFPNPQGESSALANAHITGGVFNAKGLCGCLRIYNFRGFRISGCQFYNAATSAFKVERPGYELVMSDCSARNEYPGLTGNVGFELLCNDCHYHDLISVNYHTGFKATYNPLIARCHPWIGSTDFPTYYSGSIGFDLSGAVGAQVTDCYSDTCQTHYKLGSLTKLIGCVTLSVKSETFPIDEYGDVNLIHNDYNNNVIIGCTFRTSGVTPVRNSGNKQVTEIGCTYT